MIIWRYLTKEVYGTLLATTAIVLVILISNQFIHYLDQAAAGNLPLKTVMQLMSLQVPLLLGLLLPLGLFLGILLAYGRLYADSEMLVMFACGVSKQQLLAVTLLISALIGLLVAFLMMWLEPKMTGIKRHVLQQAASSSPLERIYPDQFMSLKNGEIIVYVKEIGETRRSVGNVFIAEHDQSNNWNVIMANAAEERDNADGRYIVFKEGKRYTGTPGKRDYQVVDFNEYGVRLDVPVFTPPAKADSMSMAELWRMRHQDREYAAELQWRISLPLSVLVLGLIALPLSQVKPRHGRYAQFIPAVIIYIIYADLLFLSQAWVQKGAIGVFPGMWWVHGIMLLLAIFLLSYFFEWRFWERKP